MKAKKFDASYACNSSMVQGIVPQLLVVEGVCKKHLFILLHSVAKQVNFREYYKIRKLIFFKLEK
jgi:hypothetical protein